MMNFLKGYDWVLLGTVIVGSLVALCVYHKAKRTMDKKAMDKTTTEAS